MVKGIHILGASGSGTTTLGKALSEELNFTHFDSDDYFWVPTNPPFIKKRTVEERQNLLMKDVCSHEKWVISGSFYGWGDIFISKFDLVVYLWIPSELRLERLSKRETMRFGKDRISCGGDMYENHKNFIEWASKYDIGGLDMRSKSTHEKWLKKIKCPILRMEREISVDESISVVKSKIKEIEKGTK